MKYLETHRVWDNEFKFYINNLRSESWYGLKTIVEDQKCSVECAIEIQNNRNRWLRDLIKHGDTIIDVGANEGFVSLAMVMVSNGKLIAIEPNPDNIPILKENLDINNVKDYLVIDKIADEYSGLSKSFDNEKVSDIGKEIGTISLDDIGIAPDVIKIDVEGYEVPVLRGSKNILKYKPKLEIEVHLSDSVDMRKSGFDPAELLDILFSNNYKIYWHYDWDKYPDMRECSKGFELRKDMKLICL